MTNGTAHARKTRTTNSTVFTCAVERNTHGRGAGGLLAKRSSQRDDRYGHGTSDTATTSAVLVIGVNERGPLRVIGRQLREPRITHASCRKEF